MSCTCLQSLLKMYKFDIASTALCFCQMYMHLIGLFHRIWVSTLIYNYTNTNERSEVSSLVAFSLLLPVIYQTRRWTCNFPPPKNKKTNKQIKKEKKKKTWFATGLLTWASHLTWRGGLRTAARLRHNQNQNFWHRYRLPYCLTHACTERRYLTPLFSVFISNKKQSCLSEHISCPSRATISVGSDNNDRRHYC